MIVDELMPVELVVGARERTLHEVGNALAAEHGDEQVRGPIPRLTAVQVGKVIVERQHRRDDALFAFLVERVEIVRQPVAHRARSGANTRRAHPPGDQGEVAGERLVVIALRAVEHRRE